MEPVPCGPDGGGGSGGSTPNTAQNAIIQAARDLARIYLIARRECFNLLSPGVDDDRTPGALNPLDALNTATITFDDRRDDAFAAIPAEQLGTGVNGTITVFPGFNSVRYSSLQYLPGVRLTRPLDAVELRARILLHEIGHLTGVNPPHNKANGDVGQAFNTQLLFKCLEAA
jgi:hypothetical protein